MVSEGTLWYLYVLSCHDGSFYCGVTTDIERRLKQHNAGSAARYTRARLPVTLLRAWPCGDHSSALRSEAAFKKLNRAAKKRRLTQETAVLFEGSSSPRP
jgi:putative endonuclease